MPSMRLSRRVGPAWIDFGGMSRAEIRNSELVVFPQDIIAPQAHPKDGPLGAANCGKLSETSAA
jgi:hypothetical protein